MNGHAPRHAAALFRHRRHGILSGRRAGIFALLAALSLAVPGATQQSDPAPAGAGAGRCGPDRLAPAPMRDSRLWHSPPADAADLWAGDWRFGGAPDQGDGVSLRILGRTTGGDDRGRGVNIEDDPGISTLIEALTVDGAKYGVRLEGSGETIIRNLSFTALDTPDGYGGAVLVGADDAPSRGRTFIVNAFADAGVPPLDSYDDANSDFLSSERGNAPVLARFVTARNFADAMIDAKSPVVIGNASLSSAHRALRVWSGQWVLIANAEVTVPPGRSLIWLDGDGATVMYHNVLWNGAPEPDPELIEGEGTVVRLPADPLAALAPMFAPEIHGVTLEFSGDCGGGWQTLATLGGDGALAGDVRLAAEIPAAGHVRAQVALADGTREVSGALAVAPGAQSLHLSDLPPPGAVAHGGGRILAEGAPAPQIQAQSAATLYLADADTEERLVRLEPDTVVSEDLVAGRQVTVVAEPITGIESVRFDYNSGAVVAHERNPPYALFSDRGEGDLSPGMTLSDGEHQLDLTLFGDDAGTEVLSTGAWRFRVGPASGEEAGQ